MENNFHPYNPDPRAGQIGFVHRIMPISRTGRDFWLSVPEFVEEVLRRMTDERITAEILLQVMIDVNETMQQYKGNKQGRVFSFRTANHTINQMKKAVYGTVDDVEPVAVRLK